MKPTVLIVDDDASNLASLIRIFERLDLRALPATSGREALDVLRGTPIEVVLTDLNGILRGKWLPVSAIQKVLDGKFKMIRRQDASIGIH